MSCARSPASRWIRTSSRGSMTYRLCGESERWLRQRTMACTVFVPSASNEPSSTPQHSLGYVSSPCRRRSIHSAWAIRKVMVNAEKSRKSRSLAALVMTKNKESLTAHLKVRPFKKPEHSSSSATWWWPRRSELLPKALAQVVVGAIRKDGHDDGIGLGLFGHAKAAHHRRGRGDAHQQAFFAGQPLDHGVRLLGADEKIVAGDRRVVDMRHDGTGHVLGAFNTVERRVGLQRNAANVAVQFLQPA